LIIYRVALGGTLQLNGFANTPECYDVKVAEYITKFGHPFKTAQINLRLWLLHDALRRISWCVKTALRISLNKIAK
jgi:fumarate hydratase class II